MSASYVVYPPQALQAGGSAALSDNNSTWEGSWSLFLVPFCEFQLCLGNQIISTLAYFNSVKIPTCVMPTFLFMSTQLMIE